MNHESTKMLPSGRERVPISVQRFTGLCAQPRNEVLAIEEPLEIQLGFGERNTRKIKPISVTMRTPGHDDELALGFLLSEGVIRDIDDVELVVSADHRDDCELEEPLRKSWTAGNAVRVELVPGVEPSVATLQRNFYTTSSCGVCGKASLQALKMACPPPCHNDFRFSAELLYELHPRLRSAQSIFLETGGIHSAALFDSAGNLIRIREDVGRHNALDKLVGASMCADELPLRNKLLVLSGRASFELLQKAVMAGIPMVASVGAPSSLAVAIARDFDITLVGFLREDHFNVYHGAERLQSKTSDAAHPSPITAACSSPI